jgi:hypothetical protein
VGIARRKFAAVEANLLIEERDDGEETDPARGSMSDALHWQASHTPSTGNRVYGGTVNFRGGLTDAGLQEFRHVSRLWHRFVRDPLQFQPALATPHKRAEPATPWEWEEGDHSLRGSPRSTSSRTPSSRSVVASAETRSCATPFKRRRDDDETPIARRIARREAPARTRRRWMDQAYEVLQRMYGVHAQYRSRGQQQAMEYILAGAGQVLAILRTTVNSRFRHGPPGKRISTCLMKVCH